MCCHCVLRRDECYIRASCAFSPTSHSQHQSIAWLYNCACAQCEGVRRSPKSSKVGGEEPYRYPWRFVVRKLEALSMSLFPWLLQNPCRSARATGRSACASSAAAPSACGVCLLSHSGHHWPRPDSILNEPVDLTQCELVPFHS